MKAVRLRHRAGHPTERAGRRAMRDFRQMRGPRFPAALADTFSIATRPPVRPVFSHFRSARNELGRSKHPGGARRRAKAHLRRRRGGVRAGHKRPEVAGTQPPRRSNGRRCRRRWPSWRRPASRCSPPSRRPCAKPSTKRWRPRERTRRFAIRPTGRRSASSTRSSSRSSSPPRRSASSSRTNAKSSCAS